MENNFTSNINLWPKMSSDVYQEFKKINKYITPLSILAISIIFGILCIPAFRYLRKRFRTIERGPEEVNGIARSANAIANSVFHLGEKIEFPDSSTNSNGVLELRVQTLNNLSSGSFSQILCSFLQQAKIHTNSTANIWALATYYLFNESYIDAAECHPRLLWKECDECANDPFTTTLLDRSQVSRIDVFNNGNHQIAALSFKEKFVLLTDFDKERLVNSILQPIEVVELEPNLAEIYSQIREFSQSIRKRYQNIIVLTDDTFSYREGIRDFIHQILKRILLESPSQLKGVLHDNLLDEAFSKKVCKEIILRLLSSASIKNNKLNFNGLILNFKKVSSYMPLSAEDLKNISLYEVNDLTSKNQLEEPYISDHALKISQNLEHIKNGDLDSDLQRVYDEFTQWIYKNYYLNFCARFLRKLPSPQDAIRKRTELSIKQSKPQTQSIGRVIKNDKFGDTFMKQLQKTFNVKHSWSYSGSCFLSCFIPESGKDRYEGIMTIRARISSLILEKMDSYLECVEVIPGYKCEGHGDKWAVCDKNTTENKRAAILKRCEDILKSSTYLMEVEFELTAQILTTPIYIYKRRAGSFHIDDSEQIQPHIIYGVRFNKKKPYYVLDDMDHYKPLIKK